MGMAEAFRRYPIKVRILRPKGGGYDVIFDKGRKVRFKDGSTRMRLLKHSYDLEYPENRFLVKDPRGKDNIDYFSPVEGEFYPMEPTAVTVDGVDVMKIRPVEKDVQFWSMNESIRIMKKYAREKSKWETLIPILSLVIPGALMLLAVLFVSNALVDVSAAANGIASQINSQVDAHIRVVVQDALAQQAQQIPPANQPPFG